MEIYQQELELKKKKKEIRANKKISRKKVQTR